MLPINMMMRIFPCGGFWAKLGGGALIFAVLGVGSATAAQPASLVIESETGRILHALNPDKPIHPASLTKMMTLYLVFEALEKQKISLQSRLSVSRQASRQPASRLGLKAGSSIRLEQAILALVTKSANDVATVVAEALGGGSETSFAHMMTRKARQLGMRRTQFRNASGIHDPQQVSTARDMSVLARALLDEFPQYYDYFSVSTFRYGTRTYGNHNKLLKSYEGLDGIKTGYIRASGYNLAASAEQDGHRLIGIVIGGKTGAARDRQMASLLNQAFAKLKTRSRLVLPTIASHSPSLRPAPRIDPLPPEVALKQQPLWSVQLGAFKHYAPALRLAEKAVEKLSTGKHRIQVTRPEESTRGRFYRARLTGYDQRQARTVCEKVKALGMDCLLIAPRREKLAWAVPGSGLATVSP